MKKIACIIAASMLVPFVGMAGTMSAPAASQNRVTVLSATQVESEWKEVKLEELPEKVQAAVKARLETCDLVNVASNEAKKLYRVTLTVKATGAQSIIYLTDEGNEVPFDL